MTYCYFPTLPRLEDIEPSTYTEVLVADTRLGQGRIRAAVDAVFAAHPGLGAVIEPRFDTWTTRPGGGWGWAVEPRQARSRTWSQGNVPASMCTPAGCLRRPCSRELPSVWY
jgi:hypothetical protein